jgi:hypothetical protein
MNYELTGIAEDDIKSEVNAFHVTVPLQDYAIVYKLIRCYKYNHFLSTHAVMLEDK